jgi:phosphoribosyl-AMP cyclohydrolase
MQTLNNLNFDANGLIPAVCQDKTTGEVLMVAWMNAEALKHTLESQEAHFWSRSRNELWHKGATSGNFLKVMEIWADCDGDTLLVKVLPKGPACHTGERSCFFRRLARGNRLISNL